MRATHTIHNYKIYSRYDFNTYALIFKCVHRTLYFLLNIIKNTNKKKEREMALSHVYFENTK